MSDIVEEKKEVVEKPEFEPETEAYFDSLGVEIQKNYEIAERARAKGLDPVDKVEVPLAMTMAAKVVRLISTVYPQLDNEDIINRLLELEKEYGALEPQVTFKIAEEVSSERYCKFDDKLQAMDAGIRVGFAYTTLGVVSSPIEGFTEIKTGDTKDGKKYLKAYFSGPIRSAGTTASCVVLMLIDYIRQLFGYARYDPTEDECKRFVTELFDYHERVTNLQYCPTEEEALFIAKNMPIQIAGDPTESREVSNYKDLNRVDTNFIRGGFCLVSAEGMAQKAPKGLRLLKKVQKSGIKVEGWEWLDEYVELHEKQTTGKSKGGESPTYIKDLVAGRPVFGHPGKGFRFRYGRSRVAGFSAVSVHPATMAVSDDFIGTGTQLKIEKPTKGCAVTPCDEMDGPIVKFRDGSVRKMVDYDETKLLYKEIEEIIYFGDLLFPLGDVINRNAILPKSGYVEEWWDLELKSKNWKVVDCFNVSLKEAIELSERFKVALHPNYIYYWNQIDYNSFLGFIDWFQHARINNCKILFPYNSSEKERFKIGKRALELLGVEHTVTTENIVLDEKNSGALLVNLGFDREHEGELEFDFDFKKERDIINVDGKMKEGEIVLEIVNKLSKFKIKDKAGDFIGSRMGRPEKAKLRKLIGSPNVLFPIGNEGGRLRSVNEAVEVGSVKAEFPFKYCEKCKRESIYNACEICGGKNIQKKYCRMCKSEIQGEKCEEHDRGDNFKTTRIDMKHYFDKARARLGMLRVEVPALIKGVRGTSSGDHDLELLEKGLLRAKHNLQVNKDGTIRYDMTELPLSHFKPCEIEVGFEKLRELGYNKDCNGEELTRDDQILELKPHDVLLPCNEKCGDEKADEVFVNICKFMDELLVKVYGLDAFFNVKTRDDLVGKMCVCMAPHNCAGVISRIIGFSKVQGLVGSPYLHAAMRRDCVYPTTNFVYSENGVIKSGQIGNYVEELIKTGAKTKKIDSYGTSRIELEKGKEIYSFGVDPKTKELKKKKIKYFIKGKSPERWIRIKTSSGRKQVMTPRHKFIYLDENNNFKIKKASEIKKGDRIGILKNFNLKNEINEIFLPEFLSDNVPLEKLNDIRVVGAQDFFKNLVKRIGEKKLRKLLNLNGSFNNLFDWYNIVPLNHVKILIDESLMKWEEIPNSARLRSIFNNKKWNFKLKITEELMNILGYYAAEGHSRQNRTVSQISFRMMDKKQSKRLVSLIETVFGINPSLGEENTKITICNKLIYYLFKYCFKVGEGAYKKRVPDIVYNSSEKLVKSYLSAYFDGDGTIIYGKNKFICFYSVSRELLDGISLLGSRFGLFGRFYNTQERLPGKKVLEKYKLLGKEPKKHILQHLVYSGRDFYKIVQLLKPVNERKLKIINNVELKETKERKIKYENKFFNLDKVGDIVIDIVKEVDSFNDNNSSYCFDIDWKSEEDKNVLWGEQIINFRCDGDEAAIMLLLDVLVNFSRKFLPSHRGGTQDAPLVLNGKIYAKEVDDQILDFELVNHYPLELYEKAEQGKHSSEIEIEMVKQRIGRGEDPYVNTGFTHNTSNMNMGAVCSSYKILPSMREKVEAQMLLCEKLRAVDEGDVARLIIDRHFMRDLKGNLRKFSQQSFRCGKCNTIYRRPPLNGKCETCHNPKLIFTISYGSIVKYLEPGIDLTNNYNVPEYIKQDLQLTKKYIESIFGRETEKQEALEKWF
jgi:DNA polymerase II large subunit